MQKSRNLKSLGIEKSRQMVYYGPVVDEDSLTSKSERKLHSFVHSCHQMRLFREERELRRLQILKLISNRFYTVVIFKSWYQYLLCRRIHRKHVLLCHWKIWRKCWLYKRYSILLLLANQKKHLLRYALSIWWKNTLYLRAIACYRKHLLTWTMNQWKVLLQNSLRKLLIEYFRRWKLFLLILTKLRKLDNFYRILPRRAFLHWKECTFRVVDLSSVLERIRMRILESIFYYLWNLSERLKHERLLASLPSREPALQISSPETPQVIPLKSPKKTRKAKLDMWHTPCRCVYNICTGQRCVCTFDTHLRRRIAMCYDELKEVEAEKKIAKEVIKQALKDFPRKPATPQRRPQVATGQTPPGASQRVEVVKNSPIKQQNTPVRTSTSVPAPSPALPPSPSLSSSPRPRPPPPPTAPVTPPASPSQSRDLTTPSRSSIDRNVHQPAIPPTPTPAPAPAPASLQNAFLIPAHQGISFTPHRHPPPLHSHHHDATPDRRRKEAMLKVKGTPTPQAMSRWSRDSNLN